MKHREESPQDFLNARLLQIRSRNPRFSLRALAARSAVAVSSLSDFLRNRRSLSTESALKLALTLKLTPTETEYFLALLQRDSTESASARGKLTGKIDALRENLASADALEIRALMDSTEVRSAHHYTLPGTATTRSLILLRDRRSKEPVLAFYEHFSAPERIVASNSYFLPNPDGTFRVYLVESSQNGIVPTLQCQENLALQLRFVDGFPEIENLHLKRLGTSLYSIAHVQFFADKVVHNGVRYDHERPDFKEDFQTVYIKPRT